MPRKLEKKQEDRLEDINISKNDWLKNQQSREKIKAIETLEKTKQLEAKRLAEGTHVKIRTFDKIGKPVELTVKKPTP